jgi:hypothetical protein
MTAPNTAATTTPPAGAARTAAARHPDAPGPDAPASPTQPADSLIAGIVTALAPLFLSGRTAGHRGARRAALETLNAYQPGSPAELLIVAQIIGFGLAALDSLRLSMQPDLSLSRRLRLRGGANALNRAAQQNARALETLRRHPPPPPLEPAAAAADPEDWPADDGPSSDGPSGDAPADDAPTQAAVEAALAQARAMVSDAYASWQAAPPAAAADLPPDAAGAPAHDPAWWRALSSLAGEAPGAPASAPPASRRADLLRATALSSPPADLPPAARDAWLQAQAARGRR